MKTLKQIIAALNERGIHPTEIGRRIGHPFSAIYKVARGEQTTLGYEVGKKIEQLEARTRRMKAKEK